MQRWLRELLREPLAGPQGEHKVPLRLTPKCLGSTQDEADKGEQRSFCRDNEPLHTLQVGELPGKFFAVLLKGCSGWMSLAQLDYF